MQMKDQGIGRERAAEAIGECRANGLVAVVAQASSGSATNGDKAGIGGVRGQRQGIETAGELSAAGTGPSPDSGGLGQPDAVAGKTIDVRLLRIEGIAFVDELRERDLHAEG